MAAGGTSENVVIARFGLAMPIWLHLSAGGVELVLATGSLDSSRPGLSLVPAW